MQCQTKELIANTLSEMVKIQHFDSITITDLVERCNVSRQTFYYHFSDLTDVLEFIFNRKVESIILECTETADLKTSIRIMLEAGLMHQRFLHIVLESRLRGKIENTLLDAIKKGLLLGFESIPSSRPLSREQIYLMIEFFSYGIMGVLMYRDIHELEDLDRAASGIYALIRNTISPTSK